MQSFLRTTRTLFSLRRKKLEKKVTQLVPRNTNSILMNSFRLTLRMIGIEKYSTRNSLEMKIMKSKWSCTINRWIQIKLAVDLVEWTTIPCQRRIWSNSSTFKCFWTKWRQLILMRWTTQLTPNFLIITSCKF